MLHQWTGGPLWLENGSSEKPRNFKGFQPPVPTSCAQQRSGGKGYSGGGAVSARSNAGLHYPQWAGSGLARLTTGWGSGESSPRIGACKKRQ
jgi:hypothetical protein